REYVQQQPRILRGRRMKASIKTWARFDLDAIERGGATQLPGILLTSRNDIRQQWLLHGTMLLLRKSTVPEYAAPVSRHLLVRHGVDVVLPFTPGGNPGALWVGTDLAAKPWLMGNDDLLIAGDNHIHLERIDADLQRKQEPSERILRRETASATVALEVDGRPCMRVFILGDPATPAVHSLSLHGAGQGVILPLIPASVD